MTEYGILMSAPMVRAILDGRKTQTRRVVSPKNSLVNGGSPCMRKDPAIISAWCNLDFNDAFIDPGPSPSGNEGPYLKVAGGEESRHRVYPRIWRGDLLWVRETWHGSLAQGYVYRADLTAEQLVEERSVRRLARSGARWKPSIHMPRRASRLTLTVSSARPERLQDIQAADALAEGLDIDSDSAHLTLRAEFAELWQRINGHRPGCAWADNPWVWAIAFVPKVLA